MPKLKIQKFFMMTGPQKNGKIQRIQVRVCDMIFQDFLERKGQHKTKDGRPESSGANAINLMKIIEESL